MELKDVIKPQKKERIISIRISDENLMFLKRHDVSPTKLFNFALNKIKEQRKWKQ